MDISCFDDLLAAARAQSEPQRLLFVFTRAELPDDATAEQRAGFASGQGGALVPAVCVDKGLDEIPSFAAFVEESLQFSLDWVVVFAATISGHDGKAPTTADAEGPLNQMVAAIKAGTVSSFIPFNNRGEAVQLG